MRKLARVLILTSLALSLLGCSFSNRVYKHSIRYNEAVGRAEEELLLLNILRAKDRLPMHFTAISQVKGSLAASLGSDGEASFVESASNAYTLTPSASYESNPVFDVSVLNSDTFMKGILTPVSLETAQYYIDQGWPIDLLFYLLVEKVEFTEPPLKDIDRHSEQKTFYSGEDGDEADAFKELAKWLVDNKRSVAFEQHMTNFGPALAPKSLDELVRIANSERELVLSSCTKSREQDSPPCANQDDYQLRNSQLVLSIRSQDKSKYRLSTAAPGQDSEESSSAGGDPPPSLGHLVLRSPASILYFLGELARKTTRDPNDAITLPRGNTPGEKLFVVLKGDGHAGDVSKKRAYVKVHFDGADYYIPHNGNYDATDSKSPAGRSMQCLALVSQLLSLQQNSKDLPTTQSVTIVGN